MQQLSVVTQGLVFLVGLMAGILLESRVFHAFRITESTSSPAVAAATVAMPSSGPAKPTLEYPTIQIADPVFDFGTAERGDKVEHAFPIRNVGKATLVIEQILPSCGCTTAGLDQKRIEPGQSVDLKVVLDLKGRIGPQNNTIVIKSNDPHAAGVRLTVLGKAISRIVSAPEVLDFGRITSDAPAQVASVQSVDGLKFQVLRTEVSDSGILVANVDETVASTQYSVSIDFQQRPAEGAFRGWVKVLTDHPGAYKEIVIPIRAQVGEGGAILVGDEPVIQGPILGGGTADLKDLHGQVAVVVFWASWCGHCQKEIPNLLALHNRFHSQGVSILGVNMDQETSQAESAVSKWNIPWANIHFPGEPGSKKPNPLAQKYHVNGVPAVYLVGRNGRVQSIGLRGPGLLARVEQLLKPAAIINAANQ